MTLSCSGKVAVVSNGNMVNIFKMVGCETFVVKTIEEAVKILERLVNENFSLVFVVSSLAKQISKTISKHKLSSATLFSEIPG